MSSDLAFIDMNAVISGALSCACSIDVSNAAYEDLFTAIMNMSDGSAGLVSLLNNEVPALISALMGTGGGMCTPECKDAMKTVINLPTTYLSSSTTMHALYTGAETMLGLGSDLTSLLPTTIPFDSRLPAIAANNLPNCICGVDYVGFYNLAKTHLISALTDESYSAPTTVAWYTDQLVTWANAFTGSIGICSEACKQGFEAYYMHWTEVSMAFLGVNGGLSGLGLQNFQVTDTTISTNLLGCFCLPMTAAMSALKATLDAAQPVLDLFTSGNDFYTADLQTTITSVVGGLKANLKSLATAMFGADAGCSTECQAATYNLGHIGWTLEQSATASTSPLASDIAGLLNVSDVSLPASLQAVVPTVIANQMPCLCAPTTDHAAAVDAIWAPIVETMSANVNGITAGTVPNGQQMSAMLVATISTPANMGMCASTECKALLSATNTIVSEMHSAVLQGTAPTAACSATQVATCLTDPEVLNATNLESWVSAGPSSCAISSGLTIAPLWWVGCGLSTACPEAMGVGGAYVAKAEIVAAGDVADYDTDAEKAPLITAFAQSVGAAVEDVTLTVEAASVKLTFEVVTKSEVAKAAFESTMTTWTAQPAVATAALGVPVQSTTLKETVAVAPPPSPPPPMTPPPMPPPTSSEVDIVVIAGIVAGVVAVLVLCLVILLVLKCKKAQKDVSAS